MHCTSCNYFNFIYGVHSPRQCQSNAILIYKFAHAEHDEHIGGIRHNTITAQYLANLKTNILFLACCANEFSLYIMTSLRVPISHAGCVLQYWTNGILYVYMHVYHMVVLTHPVKVILSSSRYTHETRQP